MLVFFTTTIIMTIAIIVTKHLLFPFPVIYLIMTNDTISLKHCLRTSMVVQWLSLCTPNAGGQGSIPGQGTRFHMLQLKKACVLQQRLKIPHAVTKTWHNQINISLPTPSPALYFLKGHYYQSTEITVSKAASDCLMETANWTFLWTVDLQTVHSDLYSAQQCPPPTRSA